MNALRSGWYSQELRPAQLFRIITTSVLIFLLEVIVVVSFGALIFSGDLSAQVAYGITFLAAGNAILLAIVALFGSYPGSIAVEQDAPGAILAIAAASLVASLPAGASQAEKFSTIVVMVIAAAITTGLFFLLLGIFKLGGLVRFLPYPVMGGFLAGTGWLLLTGGIGIMVSPVTLKGLLNPDTLLFWLPGLILGAVFLLINRRTANPILLPAVFFGSVILFYLISRLAGFSQEQLQASGWFLGEIPSGRLWFFPLNPEFLTHVNWTAIKGQLFNLAPVAFISTIALLLNANGIELVAKRDINLNKELVVTGLGNIFAGLVGGQIGYHAISFSTLNHNLAGGKRLVGLITALFFAIAVFSSLSVLRYVPRFALAGLIVYIGLALLFEWVVQAWFKFPKIDFLIILSILAVIALQGFMLGVLVGLVMTIALFVVNYSQVDVIRHELSGVTFNSRVTRSHRQRELLDRSGYQLLILQLQGFIFFGTANRLYEQIQKRTRQAGGTLPVHYVVIDFKQVSGLDSTGLLSFQKLLQLAQGKQLCLLLTGLHGRVAGQFERGGFHEQPGLLYFFPDLDHAVEWYENQMLASELTVSDDQERLLDHLTFILPAGDQVDKLIGHLHRRELAAGEAIIRQNEDADLIYFIESGQVTAQLEAPGKDPVRLETMRGGRVVGEIGFYLGTKRTATVVADQPSVVYCLSRKELEAMEATDPDAAYTFHRIIIHLLSERVTHLIRTVNSIQQ